MTGNKLSYSNAFNAACVEEVAGKLKKVNSPGVLYLIESLDPITYKNLYSSEERSFQNKELMEFREFLGPDWGKYSVEELNNKIIEYINHVFETLLPNFNVMEKHTRNVATAILAYTNPDFSNFQGVYEALINDLVDRQKWSGIYTLMLVKPSQIDSQGRLIQNYLSLYNLNEKKLITIFEQLLNEKRYYDAGSLIKVYESLSSSTNKCLTENDKKELWTMILNHVLVYRGDNDEQG